MKKINNGTKSHRETTAGLQTFVRVIIRDQIKLFITDNARGEA